VGPLLIRRYGNSFSFARAFHASQLFRNCAFAPSNVATRWERASSAVGVHGPEPAQIVGTAAGLINAPDLPLASKHGVVRPVFVDPGAEPGRAE
jgi:hypothetical protein